MKFWSLIYKWSNNIAASSFLSWAYLHSLFLPKPETKDQGTTLDPDLQRLNPT